MQMDNGGAGPGWGLNEEINGRSGAGSEQCGERDGEEGRPSVVSTVERPGGRGRRV